MSCWNKEELENMLEDVVNVLNLSSNAIGTHGPLGTPPADLVQLVLNQKDLEIKMLKSGMTAFPCPLKPMSEEAAVSLLKEALAMFRCTQDPTIYPKEHWSNKATELIAVLTGH